MFCQGNWRQDGVKGCKRFLSGIEMCFRAEGLAMVEVINVFPLATKAQTSLFEALCNDMKTMNVKMEALCSHPAHLRDIEQNLTTIANGVKGLKRRRTLCRRLFRV